MTPADSSPPPRRLLLMRHAKSDWSDGSLTDHQRPLNRRGRRDAPRMAEWLAETANLPELILCSTAERTRETAAWLNETWSQEVPVVTSRDLYLATPETILSVIRSDGCDAASLLVLAHNPGISQLVSLLAGKPLEMPTAAIAVFDVDVPSWDRLRSPDQVAWRALMKPKALPAS